MPLTSEEKTRVKSPDLFSHISIHYILMPKERCNSYLKPSSHQLPYEKHPVWTHNVHHNGKADCQQRSTEEARNRGDFEDFSHECVHCEESLL